MPLSYKGMKEGRSVYPLLFCSIIFVQLLFLAGFYFFCNSLLSSGMDPAWAGRKGMVVLSLLEVSFYLLILPLMPCFLLSEHYEAVQRDLLNLLPGRKRTKWRGMLKTAVFVMLLILPAAIPAGYLHIWHIPSDIITGFILILFFISLFISAVNHFTRALFRDTFASIPAAYLVILFLTGAVIFMNPVIEWTDDPEVIIQTTLLINPFAAIASSINLDIFRTDPLYYLSSISAYNFHYPAPVQFGLFYSFLFFVLFYAGEMISDKP